MNALEINKYGVQQMNQEEFIETVGGTKVAVALAYAGILLACTSTCPVTGAFALGVLFYTCVQESGG